MTGFCGEAAQNWGDVPVPAFGLADPGADYVIRPGGYVVVFDPSGMVAVVSTPRGLFLPGGGQDGVESPEEAAIREAREECGLDVVLARRIGVADELGFAADENVHYRKRCVFFLAHILGMGGRGEPDHELVWLAPTAAAEELRHGSQRWAVAEACRLKREDISRGKI